LWLIQGGACFHIQGKTDGNYPSRIFAPGVIAYSNSKRHARTEIDSSESVCYVSADQY
jgi:hypothetical protein